MINHKALVEQVASRGGLSEPAEAARAVKVAVAAVAHRLDVPERRRLRQALPGPERDAALATVPPTRDRIIDLLDEIGRYLDTPPERSRTLARAVFATIAEADPELVRVLCEDLPGDFAELFNPPEPVRRR